MSKYIIIFNGDVYSGGTYIYQGECYPNFNNQKPKLYKSKKVAENSAKRLLRKCAYIGDSFMIKEVIEEGKNDSL